MFNGRIITTLLMLALFLGATVMAIFLPAKAAFMPLLVGIPGVLLCLAQLVIDLRISAHPTEALAATEGPSDDEEPEDARTELQMILWLFLFTITLVCFGFIWGGPVIVTLFVRFSSRDSWMNAVFAGAGTFAVLFGVFIWLLELKLFPGLILRALF